jgi:ectoine hydroxylase-related dioxygenase (phytanoyl-CoA dioxygenase family)
MHKMGTLRHRASETGLIYFDQADGAVPAPVAAGGIVVFSSLTPHRTGPNRTRDVRKSYIVHYAPDGAAVIDPSHESATPVPANAPERQLTVVDT